MIYVFEEPIHDWKISDFMRIFESSGNKLDKAMGGEIFEKKFHAQMDNFTDLLLYLFMAKYSYPSLKFLIQAYSRRFFRRKEIYFKGLFFMCKKFHLIRLCFPQLVYLL